MKTDDRNEVIRLIAKISLLLIAFVFIFSFAIFFASIQAHAAEIDINLGATHFSHQSNGFWYQEGFPYDLRLNSPSVSLKLFTEKSESGWQFGGGYDYIGRATSDSYDVGGLDSNYSETSPTHCNGPCLPLAHWKGAGEVDGLFLGARKSSGNWIFEGGLMATRPTWHATYTNLYYCATCAPQAGEFVHHNKIMYDPYADIGYRIDDRFSLHLSVVPTHAKGDQFPAIYKAYSPTLSIEYRAF